MPILFPIIFALMFTALLASDNIDKVWKKIDTGLFIAEFALEKNVSADGFGITVIRIDPNLYSLRLLSASETGEENISARTWAQKYNLLGAINAGMYHTDYRTNCGYMKNYTHVNNPQINKKYFSVAAFNPVDPKSASFRIFDSDMTDIRKILSDYHTVIQNLRLIKRPGINRWEKQEKRWSEAALGEDRDGNILFIFCRKPFSMHELNTRLLSLPIHLTCAQHLEGGPEASLYLNHNGVEIMRTGITEEAGLNTIPSTTVFLPIPNVIGVVKK